MAFTLAEALVIFRGDDSKLKSDLNETKGEVTSAAGNMSKVLGGALLGGAALAGSAILGIGAKAWDVATDIDDATDQISASLGLSADEAKAYGEAIKQVYANNFGDSIADVGSAIEIVAKQLDLAANDPSLPRITENAFRLRDVFGTEVGESVDAAKTLIEQFGLSSDEAFSLLAQGYQQGLDRSGDFLDTIGEYSVQFAEGGATAQEFFSVLITGMQGGMLGTDKAADAFKEFRVRIQDGSKLTRASLTAIGIDAKAMEAALADGSMTALEAFDEVTYALGQTEDKSKQFQAGVGLIGTQFEDLGASVVLGMDSANVALDASADVLATLDGKYTNLGSAVEGMWRQFEVGIAPAGEAMLGFVNDNLPAIQEVVDTVSAEVAEFIAAIPQAVEDIQTAWDEDWGGMRSMVETFASEVPAELEEMWKEINLLFGREGDETTTDWENFLNGLTSFVTRWVLNTLNSLTEAFRSIRFLFQSTNALLAGDWEGLWQNLYDLMVSLAKQMINWVETFFGDSMGNAFRNALQNMWDGAKSKMEEIRQWWSTVWVPFRDLLPGSEPKDPSSPFRNLGASGAAVVDNFQAGIQERLAQLSQGFSPMMAGATSNYQIHVNMAGGGYENGRMAGRGIQDELRRRGS